MKKIGFAIVFIFIAFIASSLLSLVFINSYHKIKAPELQAIEEVKDVGMVRKEEP